MIHQINPIAFSVSGFDVSWYWLFYPLSFLLLFLTSYIYSKFYLPVKSYKNFIDFFLFCWLGTIIGGRLGYLLLYQAPLFFSEPQILWAFHLGGMSFHGAALGIALFTLLFYKLKKQNPFEYMDIVIIFTPICLLLGRIGNFINGELWGRPSELPWAMVFPHADSLTRHPSQLYEAILQGPILFFLLWTFKDFKKNGHNTLLFLMFYSVLRFVAEFFREPDRHLGFFFHFFSYGQLLSIAFFILSFLLFLRLYRSKS